MDKRKKIERNANSLLALLEEMGGGEIVAKLKEQPIVNEHDLRPVLEAEGILLTLQSDKRTVLVKPCKECGDPFGTNYKYVAYCSNACRAIALKHIGIRWDPTKKDQQRWGSIDNPSQLPIVITKAALEQLRHIVDVMQAIQTQNEMVEFVEHQSQTQIETPNLSDKLSPLLEIAYREGLGEYRNQIVQFPKLQNTEPESHKSEELVTTSQDPEPLVSKQNESQVKFDLDLFQ